MKISKVQLRQIIKEELAAALDEQDDEGPGIVGDVTPLPAGSSVEKAGAEKRAEFGTSEKGRDILSKMKTDPDSEIPMGLDPDKMSQWTKIKDMPRTVAGVEKKTIRDN